MKAVQCKMARVATGLGVRELAEKAGVSPDTVARLERGDVLKAITIEAIKTALETPGEVNGRKYPGVIFVPENGDGAGVRLKKEGD